MNRELKFRAWDGVEMQIFDLGLIDGGSITVSPKSPKSEHGWCAVKDLEVMQYTGLKDKRGKEIYEGDILAFEREMNFRKETVLPFLMEWNENYYGGIPGWTAFSPQKDIVVVGNIFENPELLER